MLREDVVFDALALVGTPYQHQGRSTYGIDCIGTITSVALKHNYPFKDNINYSAEWHIHGSSDMLYENLLRYMDEVPVGSALPGDVYLFKIGKTKICSHVGFVMPDDAVVHAWRERGEVVHHHLDFKWHHRVRHCFRFRGIT